MPDSPAFKKGVHPAHPYCWRVKRHTQPARSYYWRWKGIHPARPYCWWWKGIHPARPYCWRWKGIPCKCTLHVHTAGCGNGGYTLHVHSVGCGKRYCTPCTSILMLVERDSLCTFILLAVEKTETPCTCILLAEKGKTPSTFIQLAVERDIYSDIYPVVLYVSTIGGERDIQCAFLLMAVEKGYTARPYTAIGGMHIHTAEPVFLHVYGAPELIPRNEFRQPM
jgi:hypothetical protein